MTAAALGPVVGITPKAIEHTTELKDDTLVSVNEVIDDSPRWLIHSPYEEQEHQLDLHTLNDENALLARALVHMKCLRPDYATAPYTETFNWDEVHQELKDLIRKTGKTFKETSFYIVAFRSQIPPTTVYEDLGTLDKAAHKEANDFGGFLKYWFGSPDAEGRNLATCFWRSRPDAVRAGHGGAHRKAARATASMYSFWKIDRHRLIIRDGAESFEFIDWED